MLSPFFRFKTLLSAPLGATFAFVWEKDSPMNVSFIGSSRVVLDGFSKPLYVEAHLWLPNAEKWLVEKIPLAEWDTRIDLEELYLEHEKWLFQANQPQFELKISQESPEIFQHLKANQLRDFNPDE